MVSTLHIDIDDRVNELCREELAVIKNRIEYIKRMNIDPCYASEVKPFVDEELRSLLDKYLRLFALLQFYSISNTAEGTRNNDVINAEREPVDFIKLQEFYAPTMDNGFSNFSESSPRSDTSLRISAYDILLSSLEFEKRSSTSNSNIVNAAHNESKKPALDSRRLEDGVIQRTAESSKNIDGLKQKSASKSLIDGVESPKSQVGSKNNMPYSLQSVESPAKIHQLSPSKAVKTVPIVQPAVIEETAKEKVELKLELPNTTVFVGSRSLIPRPEFAPVVAKLSERIAFLPLAIGPIFMVGGLYLLGLTLLQPSLVNSISLQIISQLTSLIGILPGVFVPVGMLNGLGLGSIGVATSLIGLNMLLLAFGLFLKGSLSKQLGVCIFAFAALFSMVSFLSGGIRGAPYALVSLSINSAVAYLLYKK